MGLTSQLKGYALLGLLLTLSTSQLFAQSNCHNVGFEYGDLSNFEIYHGFTDDIQLNQPLVRGTIPDQHVIQKKTDGFDKLAMAECITNKELPVVGQGLGEYSLRLGNQDGGKRVARIVRELDVTPENNFLILSYAVLLEDPSHRPDQQPRFIFKIKDVNDNLLSCGTYDVFAGPNIDGFENCGEWRVRPWTSAGFELQSYIGQRVRLEITSIDCDKSGHGGYAYIDLTCRPLEIILSNYCENEQVAYLTVTEGFDEYRWNTGHVSNQIVINNPQPGAKYTVEVTSATGCTISLSDTLPYFEQLPLARLEQEPDRELCEESNFLYYPKGENISRLELLGSGYVYDSILINTLTDRTYTFVAGDDFGCKSDTMSFTVFVNQPPFVIDVEVDDVGCSSTGKATIETLDNFGNQFTLDGINYQESNVFDSLPEGGYYGQVMNGYGCVTEFNFFIDYITSSPAVVVNDVTSTTCDLHNGTVNVQGRSGISPYLYAIDSSGYGAENTFDNLAEGTHVVYVQDGWGCKDSIVIEIPAVPMVELELENSMAMHCDEENGEIFVHAEEGRQPYEYLLNNSVSASDGNFEALAAGMHTIIVTDADGCKDTISEEVGDIPLVHLINMEMDPDICDKGVGSFTYELRGGSQPFEYEFDNQAIVENFSLADLSTGTHTLVITDSLGCVMEEEFYIENILGPKIDLIYVVDPHCDENNGSIEMRSEMGTAPLTYSINGSLQKSAAFEKLSGGDYTLRIEDAHGCIDLMEVSLERIPVPEIALTSHQVDNCNSYEVSIEMNAQKGCAPYTLVYEGESQNFESETMVNMPHGEHVFKVIDDCGCIVNSERSLEDVAHFYVPNIIRLDDERGNDKFKISKHFLAYGRINYLHIYDRWGNEIYSASDIIIDDTNSLMWNGRAKGTECPAGSYVYQLEITDECDNTEQHQGTITLIK